MIRRGPSIHATGNRLIPVDVGRHRLLLKWLPDRGEARRERAGNRALRGSFPVADLLAAMPMPIGHLHVYRRVGSDAEDEGLLLDLLNWAEEPGPRGERARSDLDRFLDLSLAVPRGGMLATARRAPAGRLVRKLFWARAEPGGRLSSLYDGRTLHLLDDRSLPADALAEMEVTVDGRPVRLDFTGLLRRLRGHFAGEGEWWAAVLHGDPTEVNLGVPYVEFDYDTAGLNALAGNWAVFLCGILRLGGAVAPRMAPRNYGRHPLTFARVALNEPAAAVTREGGRVHLALERRCAPARLHAARRYVGEVIRPVAAALGIDVQAELPPFVAMRAAGVFDLQALPQAMRIDAVVHLADVLEGPDVFAAFGLPGLS
jgi:hypothetical protein